MENDYSGQTIRALQNIAKERGLKKYSRLSKENLIEVLKVQKNISDFNNVRGSDQDLSRQTIRGLQDIAKERGLKKYSRLSKENLIEVLTGQKNISDFNNVRGSDQDLSRQTIRGLHDIAKERGLKGYSGLSKENLIEVLNRQGQLVNKPREQRQPVRKQTVRDLKKVAKDRGLKGYSQLTKKQLNLVLSGVKKISDISHIRGTDLDLRHLWKSDLKKQPKRALQQIAKQEGYRGYSKLNKADLIERLENSDKGGYTAYQLREFAKLNGIKGFDRINKDALLKYLRELISREIEVKLVYTALNDQIRVYKGIAPPWDEEGDGYPTDSDLPVTSVVLMSLFLDNMREQMVKILSDNTGRKVKMNVEAYMYQLNNRDPEEAVPARFHSGENEIVSKETDSNALYVIMGNRIIKNLEEFLKKGSGWGLRNITEIVLKSSIYDPLKAKGHLPLPKWVAGKKVIINIQNKDDKCFLWCILR